MDIDLNDLNAFLAVARARGFRDGARASGSSASGLSEAVRRLETQLGVRLLNRTTRSVVPTEAGQRLLERLGPALNEVEAALDVVNGFRDSAGGHVTAQCPGQRCAPDLPAIVPPFLAAYPDIRLEVIADDSFVDVLAAGCDAGIRYDERLEQDMIAVPIGPRIQRFATAASPAYLDRRGRPRHPRDLLEHACLRGRFTQRRHERRGNSSARVRWCGSIPPARCSCMWCGHRSHGRCGHRRYRHRSSCLKTGCARISTAVHWSPA